MMRIGRGFGEIRVLVMTDVLEIDGRSLISRWKRPARSGGSL
jgi:hypothetical protein